MEQNEHFKQVLTGRININEANELMEMERKLNVYGKNLSDPQPKPLSMVRSNAEPGFKSMFDVIPGKLPGKAFGLF